MTTHHFLITHSSSVSVKESMDRLEKILREKNVTVFARISHSKAASDVGLALPEEELLIFGNPKVGTALMLENPAMGIELPLKIIAWQANQQTIIAYQDLDKLAEMFAIKTEKNTIDALKNFMLCRIWLHRLVANVSLTALLHEKCFRERSALRYALRLICDAIYLNF